MMTTDTAPVISLQSHRRSKRRSRELREAMRRHPSYREDHGEGRGDAVILGFASR